MMADRKKVEPLLKTARGQIDGVLKMIEDNRYCMDIMMQLQAVESLVHKAQREVLRGHLPAVCRMRLRPEIRTSVSRRSQRSSSCWIKRKRKDVPFWHVLFCLKIEAFCSLYRLYKNYKQIRITLTAVSSCTAAKLMHRTVQR